MIHLASIDLVPPEADRGVLNLADELMTVARCFRLEPAQVHESPPEGFPIILLQPSDGVHVQGESSLVDFVHPDDCVYMFGATHGILELSDPVDTKIYIPHSPTWDLFASQAAAIVLYDRFVKRGGFG
jgi:hypothetical protein